MLPHFAVRFPETVTNFGCQVMAAIDAVNTSDVLQSNPDFVKEGERYRQQHQVTLLLSFPCPQLLP